MSKPNSRWKRGNVRYDKKTSDVIRRKYYEEHGWAQGARVRKKA